MRRCMGYAGASCADAGAAADAATAARSFRGDVAAGAEAATGAGSGEISPRGRRGGGGGCRRRGRRGAGGDEISPRRHRGGGAGCRRRGRRGTGGSEISPRRRRGGGGGCRRRVRRGTGGDETASAATRARTASTARVPAPTTPIPPRSAAHRARRMFPGRPGRTRSVAWWWAGGQVTVAPGPA